MNLAGTPVWPKGLSTERNIQVGFTTVFARPAAGKVLLRLAASSRYRAWVNGVFVGHGPARGPHGHFRVDVWDITSRLKPGPNTVAIEVAGYNCNSFYVLDQPSFLHAEVSAGPKVIASTGGPGKPFTARLIRERVRKVPRYSFQRPFMEVWKLGPEWTQWRTNLPAEPEPLDNLAERRLLPHGAPLPKWEVRKPLRLLSEGNVVPIPMPARPWKDRSLVAIGPQLQGFPEAELETVPPLDLQAIRFAAAQDIDRPVEDEWREMGDGRWALIDFGTNVTGFPILKVRCETPTTLWFLFDEVLTEGNVDFKRLGCVNAVRWDLPSGETEIETFEPYTLRYLQIFADGGRVSWRAPRLREIACPDSGDAIFRCPDPQLNRIFEAARETFRQNSVDIFMDCPSRERAGWLCDSFWTARVAFALTGHCRIEACFFENYALPERFEHLPDGMLPMCYPSDHNDGVFIANWALWFLVELREFRERGGSPALIKRLRPRVERLLQWFERYRNDDGLLERIPSWVFVEWSKANEFVQDVNYPSNMLYAAALDAAGDLYNRPQWRNESARVQETIRAQSFDGEWFVDNAVRRGGSLQRTTNRSETCQYYAFFFGTATPASHPELWRRLVDEFGPDRKAKGLHPAIHPSNAFIGNYLRMELLARERRIGQILDETRSFFGYMAERTGTLWENVDASASCNHGFASHVAWLLLRDVAGIQSIDPRTRTVRFRQPELSLPSCDARLPIAGGWLKVSWKRVGEGFRRQVVVPRGWKVVS
jgi:alpha-L-rhamnosidase